MSDIAVTTAANWGAKQLEKYLLEIADRCDFLAANPFLGLACENIRPGLRKFPQGSHWIFYRQIKGGITVERVLHKKRLAKRRDFQ